MIEKICGIYKIKNLINNKVYIGKSINIYGRWYRHKYNLKKNDHYNSHLQRAWNKYGEENFAFEIIEIIYDYYDENKLNNKLYILEQYWIYHYNSAVDGYNVVVKSTYTPTCYSKVVLQIKNNEIINEFNSCSEVERILGIPATHISAVCLNKRKTARGYRWMYKDDYEKNNKIIINENKIVQLTLNNEFINEYKSFAQINKITGIDRCNISRCCNKKQKSSGGYKWMFKEDYNNL